LIKLKCFK